MADQARVDKWLWSVRIYKTRSLATEACKKNRILIQGKAVKPSRMIKVGELIEVKKNNILYRYYVKALIEKRVGAKLVEEYMEDRTPKDQLELLELSHIQTKLNREKGEGRPTKKDRRDLESFFTPD